MRAVIRDVEGCEREIQDMQGQWYVMRVRPYRTSENRIEGAVIAFLDTTPSVSASSRSPDPGITPRLSSRR